MLNKIKYAVYTFMRGRYGNDHLNISLLVNSFLVSILSEFFFEQRSFVRLISYLPLLWAVYRSLSRNITKRRQENQRFLALTRPFKKLIKLVRLNLSDKANKHYLCPTCTQIVRVPKKRGRIEISCPHCKTRFIKKT